MIINVISFRATMYDTIFNISFLRLRLVLKIVNRTYTRYDNVTLSPLLLPNWSTSGVRVTLSYLHVYVRARKEIVKVSLDLRSL